MKIRGYWARLTPEQKIARIEATRALFEDCATEKINLRPAADRLARARAQQRERFRQFRAEQAERPAEVPNLVPLREQPKRAA